MYLSNAYKARPALFHAVAVVLVSCAFAGGKSTRSITAVSTSAVSFRMRTPLSKETEEFCYMIGYFITFCAACVCKAPKFTDYSVFVHILIHRKKVYGYPVETRKT